MRQRDVVKRHFLSLSVSAWPSLAYACGPLLVRGMRVSQSKWPAVPIIQATHRADEGLRKQRQHNTPALSLFQVLGPTVADNLYMDQWKSPLPYLTLFTQDLHVAYVPKSSLPP
ncbi:hypothetical protein SRHO_G00317600 [Serrasalmus rhombeus]